MKIRLSFLFSSLLLLQVSAFAQVSSYKYRRMLTGISEPWHSITLPDSLFEKMRDDRGDLRIYGITATNDTIEAPYLWRVSKETVEEKEITFTQLNESRGDGGYYVTFHLSATQPVNTIHLQFAQKNFDWRVTVSGSQTQQTWFTLVENYRILSIKNNETDFQFTTVSFPSATFPYVRLFIKATEKPTLTAHLVESTKTNARLKNYTPKHWHVIQNKKDKRTEILLNLPKSVPISYIKVKVKETIDYVRPLAMLAITDSVKTPKGWQYNFLTLGSGTLSSLGNNEYWISPITCKKIKLVLNHYNNQPLTIDSVQVCGYVYSLAARFTEPATYFLAYGNASSFSPHYDIEQFTDKIPATLAPLTIGAEQTMKKEETASPPFFQSKAWLWGLMIFLILLLGGFTLKMLKQK